MFKDHFSTKSEQYSKFRPHYPDELFYYLCSLAPTKEKAWDCACGSGQSAIGLNKYFQKVIATDASKKQISKALKKRGITYCVATAENSTLFDSEIDLITVSQALHWFDMGAFFYETKRVLKNNGILAVWTYGLLHVNGKIDTIVNRLYSEILGEYWPPERKFVENGYREIDFPFAELNSPQFSMQAYWNFNQLIGYLETWSAIKTYRKNSKKQQLEKIYSELENLWGSQRVPKQINWPLTVIIRKKYLR